MTFSQHNTKSAKLCIESVLAIKEKYGDGHQGYTHARLAREYQVSENTIRRVLNGTSWQRVQPQSVNIREPTEAEIQASMRKLQDKLNAKDDTQPALEPSVLERMNADINKALSVDHDLDKLKGGSK